MRKLNLTVYALAILFCSFPAHADAFVFVRNAKNHTTSINKAGMRAVFTGKKKSWDSGKLVQVVLGGEGSADLGWLDAALFGVGEVALLTKIKQEVFKGEMKRPMTCAGDEECLEKVKANEGGVALVSAAAAASLPAGVAVLNLTE